MQKFYLLVRSVQNTSPNGIINEITSEDHLISLTELDLKNMHPPISSSALSSAYSKANMKQNCSTNINIVETESCIPHTTNDELVGNIQPTETNSSLPSYSSPTILNQQPLNNSSSSSSSDSGVSLLKYLIIYIMYMYYFVIFIYS